MTTVKVFRLYEYRIYNFEYLIKTLLVFIQARKCGL